ncbi:MAG TPA: peptidylprolyl isomerase [Rudaea sp.]|jgi:peptidyl-prolyl cis-trans isomerase SurA
MNKLVAVTLVALLTFAAAPTARAQALLPTDQLDRIVALAEDDVILQSELDSAVGNILAQYRTNPQQLPPRAELERQVLERLILLRLQVQRAESTGIRITDSDIDQAMQRVADSNKIDVRTLRASLEREGINYDTYRKSIREQLLVARLRQRVVQNQVNVTDGEIDILLASNSLKAGEVHLAHILITLPEGASADQIQKAHDKAEDVKKQIEGGMDFTTAAIRFSNAPDALEGGDLGWRRFDEVPEAFANLAEGMQAGQVSQVLRGPSGFHIVKLIEKRATGRQVVTEYHARHIEIAVNELVQSDEAQKTVREIRQRIVDGHEDFAKLAKQYSKDSTTAGAGGDMGWFPIDQYGSKVAETLAAMKENDISQPFQTDVGWHIMQMLGSRQNDRTDEAKREQAREVLRTRKAEDEYENFLRQVRSEAYACAINVSMSSASLPQCGAAGMVGDKKASAP